MEVGDRILILTSPKKVRNQIASFVAWFAAIYSASTVDNATVGCFLDCQVIAAPLSKKMYPVTDLLAGYKSQLLYIRKEE
jgi:hypothetical protein